LYLPYQSNIIAAAESVKKIAIFLQQFF